MSRGPDVGTMLVRAVQAMAQRHGCLVIVSAADSCRWASATFNGERHRLSLSAQPTAMLDDWLTSLTESAFPQRGPLVADLTVSCVRRSPDTVTIELDILTLEGS